MADEIGKLASETSATAENIKAIIDEVNHADIAQKTTDVAGLVEGNAQLVEKNRDNLVRLKKIIEMFRYE